jgi:hypothetical protein
MSRRGPSRRTGCSAGKFTLAVLILAAGAVSGCTSSLREVPIFGEPQNVPRGNGETGSFPAVHDMPAARDTKPMTEAERQKLEADLAAARDQQEAATNTVPPPKPPGK